MDESPTRPDDEQAGLNGRAGIELDRPTGDVEAIGVEGRLEQSLCLGTRCVHARALPEDETAFIKQRWQQLFEPIHGTTISALVVQGRARRPALSGTSQPGGLEPPDHINQCRAYRIR